MNEPATTDTAPIIPPPPRARRFTPSFDTRELVLGWCLWLIGVWALLLNAVGWVGPTHRWMIFAAMIGLMGLWPAVRLSQVGPGPDGAGAKGTVLMDWLCLNLVFQAVLWPMCLIAGWTVAQTLWIDAAVLSWSLLTALLIAWGRGFGTGGMRTLAMVACVAIVVAEPALMWAASVARGTPWQDLPVMRLSPVQTVWALTDSPAMFASSVTPNGLRVPLPWGLFVSGTGAAAVLGWAVLLTLTPRRTFNPPAPLGPQA